MSYASTLLLANILLYSFIMALFPEAAASFWNFLFPGIQPYPEDDYDPPKPVYKLYTKFPTLPGIPGIVLDPSFPKF